MAKEKTIRGQMDDYANACLHDKVAACGWVKMACERHFRDFERDDIYFSEEHAQRVINFVQLMRHVKGQFARQCIRLQPWQVFFVGSLFGWMRKETKRRRYTEANLTVSRKQGKGQWIETPIYTTKGFKKLLDVHVGDVVFDECGNPCNVIAESEINHLPCFEVVFSNGENIICDCEHKWGIWTKFLRISRYSVLPIPRFFAMFRKSDWRRTYGIFPQNFFLRKFDGSHDYQKEEVEIISIKKVPSVPTKCIQVDSPSNLFLTGRTMIPTHNSLLLNSLGHYCLTADNEMGAECILAASKESQAKDIFGVALQMVNMNKDYREFYHLKTTSEVIRYPITGSYFSFVIGTPVDGSNPHFAGIDEYHQHKTNGAYDALKTGMGARANPILLSISTAGSNFKGPYKRYLDYCRKVVSGSIADDRLFSMEYTIDQDDDWQDFSVWAKANPNMGVSVNEDYLRSQLAKAKSDVASRSNILTKHLDVWNNDSTSWIDMAQWMKCGASISMEDFRDEQCWCGLDLASRVDLCSLIFIFRRGKQYYTFGRHYLNRERVNRTENQHFRAWEAQGHLIVTDGAQTDFTRIEYDLQELATRFKIQELAYDPREATYLMQHVREWANFPCVEVRQAPSDFSEPMKVLEAKYLSKEITHPNDPVINWAASNVILKNTSNKLFYPARRDVDDKIDPIVAMIMALGRAELVHKEADFSIFVI